MRYRFITILVMVLLLCATGVPVLAQEPTATDPLASPSPQPTGTPEAVLLEGKGDDVSDPFTLKDGIAIFTVTHDGGSAFSVELLDESGNLAEFLVTTIGVYEGSRALGIVEGNIFGLIPGIYVANVSAGGNWTIQIEQPAPPEELEEAFPLNFEGAGDSVTSFFRLSAGLTTFELSHDGNALFSVELFAADGRIVDYLAIETGPYEGKKAIGVQPDNIFGAIPGDYLISVTADGNWKIVIDQGIK